jgi:hypothetical protein
MLSLPRPSLTASIILVRSRCPLEPARRRAGQAADADLAGCEHPRRLHDRGPAHAADGRAHSGEVPFDAGVDSGQSADGFVSWLRALRDDETVLVVGHTTNLPAVIEKLGGGSIATYGDNEYDCLIVLETSSEWKDARPDAALWRLALIQIFSSLAASAVDRLRCAPDEG